MSVISDICDSELGDFHSVDDSSGTKLELHPYNDPDADLDIRTGGDRVFRVHKTIMAKASGVFASMIIVADGDKFKFPIASGSERNLNLDAAVVPCTKYSVHSGDCVVSLLSVETDIDGPPDETLNTVKRSQSPCRQAIAKRSHLV